MSVLEAKDNFEELITQAVILYERSTGINVDSIFISKVITPGFMPSTELFIDIRHE